MNRFLTFLFCLAAALDLQAQTFNFPDNYNTNWPDVDNPTFVEMNGEIYFFAAKDYFDYEPHKYNCGTSSITLLKNINPGFASSEPYNGANEMMKFKTYVYFGALDGTGKTDLWRTDGTEAGTVKFKIFPYTSSTAQTITFFAADDNLMYFRASTDAGYGIWRTDGTEAGTFLISQATVYYNYVSEKKEATLLHNGKFYFQQKLLPSPISLPFASDGTVAGTVALTPAGNPDNYYMTEPYDFEPFKNSVWFGLDGPTNGGLLKTDGTLAGTQFMGGCGSDANAGKRPTALKAAGNYLYVNAYSFQNGYELFYTDGTMNGGGLVADIWPGGNGSIQTKSVFSVVGNQLFFTATANSTDKPELYVANGISGATRLDVSGPTEDSNPSLFVNYNNMLYFRATATGSVANMRVYKSDGTVAGTLDAAPDATYVFESGDLNSLPSGLYFTARVAGNDYRPATIGNCFLTTAVEDLKENKLVLFPNPAQNEVRISGIMTNETVWLMDIQGRTVLVTQMHGMEGKLDISHIPKGIYILALESGRREKIVKN